MGILDELAAHARERVEADSSALPLRELRARALDGAPADGAAFEAALAKPGMSFICEVKRASPSKGLIAPDFPYVDIARAYEAAGADAISCLTEPKWFLGSDEIFREVRAAVSTPMIRKDFTVDAYQVYQAKAMGASAVLLICAILTDMQLEEYLGVCGDLGLATLADAHDPAEVARAVAAGARIVGVNNRNLKDFTVDNSTAARLRGQVPAGVTFVSESGIMGDDDVRAAALSGADAVLVGEYLMRAEGKAARLGSMRAAAAEVGR